MSRTARSLRQLDELTKPGIAGRTENPVPMTIACAWIREYGVSKELVLAADSRLRWAGAWDSCPKVFRLPRSDAAMAFAGDTLWAYPIIAQTANNIAAHKPSRERSYDLLHAKGHALRVINAMIRLGDAVDGPDAPDSGADFLFAGFSSSEGSFRIWRFSYDSGVGAFVAERIRNGRIGWFCFIGDVADFATRALHDYMDNEHPAETTLDMQPLEVIRRMLRAEKHSTIGGPPQRSTGT